MLEAVFFVAADCLHPANATATVNLKGGKKRIQDGPFADTKETLSGYFVSEVPDLDAALVWAEKCPTAKYRAVEVRASAMDRV